MEYIEPTNEQIRSTINLGRKTKVITERRARLLAELERATAEYQPFVESGISVRKINADETEREIVTPCGNARTALGWIVESGELIGTIQFEREQRDAYGKAYWEPIFGIKIPEFNPPFSSHHANALIVPLDERFGDGLDGALRRAIIAIVYGVINGPLIAKN